jgi:uncharacterized protein (TIGR02246 family)
MQNDHIHGEVDRLNSEEQDTQSIRKVIANTETFQNDVQQFTDLVTDDVVLVNIAGRRVMGRAALYDAMKAALDTPLAKVFTTTEVDDIRFLTPDVALASCTKHISDQRSEKADPVTDKGRMTFTLVRQQDKWLVASAQTTPIDM